VFCSWGDSDSGSLLGLGFWFWVGSGLVWSGPVRPGLSWSWCGCSVGWLFDTRFFVVRLLLAALRYFPTLIFSYSYTVLIALCSFLTFSLLLRVGCLLERLRDWSWRDGVSVSVGGI
jgi:hypothetical protein